MNKTYVLLEVDSEDSVRIQGMDAPELVDAATWDYDGPSYGVFIKVINVDNAWGEMTEFQRGYNAGRHDILTSMAGIP